MSEYEFLYEIDVEYALRDFCDYCDARPDAVVEMVDAGILQPRGASSAEWRFPAAAVVRYQKARRLRRDLDLNLAGIALALDLLEHIDDLHTKLRASERTLAKFYLDRDKFD